MEIIRLSDVVIKFLTKLSDSFDQMKRGVDLNTFKSHRVSTQQVKKKCVIPVKTGIQIYGLFLDSRFRGNDDLKCFHRKIAQFRFY